MDPNKTLREIRAAVKATYCCDECASDARGEIVDKVEELDEWLTKGGSLPADWNWER